MKKKIFSAILACACTLGAISLTACAPTPTRVIPPEEDLTDVFIFMGQSNMSGQGKASESIICGEGHGFEYRAVSGNQTDGWLYPVAEPFGATERNSAISDQRTGGLVSAFCESYYQTTGVPVIGVSASISGSSIGVWQPGQKPYNEAVARLNSCLNYLTVSSELTVRSVNMVWCQGETDAWQVQNPNYDYFKFLTALFEGLKRDAKVEKCFVITPSIYSVDPTNGPYLNENKQILADKQAQFCKDDESFVLAARKFENVPLKLRDDPHFCQGVYNVAGWEAGKNAGTYIESGVEPVCDKYKEGEAEELAAKFGITLSYKT